jgi:hypothetical protein
VKFTATKSWALDLPDDPGDRARLLDAAAADPAFTTSGNTTTNLITWLIATAETGGLSFLPVSVLVEEGDLTWTPAASRARAADDGIDTTGQVLDVPGVGTVLNKPGVIKALTGPNGLYYLDDDGTLRRKHDLFGGPHDEPPASGQETGRG